MGWVARQKLSPNLGRQFVARDGGFSATLTVHRLGRCRAIRPRLLAPYSFFPDGTARNASVVNEVSLLCVSRKRTTMVTFIQLLSTVSLYQDSTGKKEDKM